MSLVDVELMRSASQWLAWMASVFCGLVMLVAVSFAGHRKALATTRDGRHDHSARGLAWVLLVLSLVAVSLWVATLITCQAWSSSPVSAVGRLGGAAHQRPAE